MAAPVDAQHSTFNQVAGHQITIIQIVPGSSLAPAVSSYNQIVSAIHNAQTSTQQLSVLADCAFQLLQVLNIQYQAGQIVEREMSGPLEELSRYVASGFGD